MIIALIAAGYIVGSLPVAWVVTRLVTGQDLRRIGSGNVGVMNTALSVHRWAGLVVFAAEVAKGALAVGMARVLDGGEVAVGLTVLATIAGIHWPIWLRGRGGRGNTAAVTALTLISWLTLILIVIVWLLARILTHNNFVAARVCLLLLAPIFGWVTQSWWSVLFGACFSLLFLSAHRPESDDHLMLKARWSTLWDFLTAPPRK